MEELQVHLHLPYLDISHLNLPVLIFFLIHDGFFELSAYLLAGEYILGIHYNSHLN